MIDVQTEQLINLSRAARLLGPGRNDRPRHPSSLVRAIHRRELEAVRCGSRWMTSAEAVQRWLEAQTDAALRGTNPAPIRTLNPSSKASEKAERQLIAGGY